MSDKSINVRMNITTLTLTNFLWGFINILYLISVQVFVLNSFSSVSNASILIGIFLSIGSISAIFPQLCSFISDYYGNKNTIVLGQLLCSISLFCFVIFRYNILLLLSSLIIFNLGQGIYDSPLQALIYKSAPANKRGKAFSIIYNISSIAGILAPVVFQINENVTLTSIFLSGSVVLFLTSIINLLMLKPVSNSKTIDFPIKKFLMDKNNKLRIIVFALEAFFWGLPISIDYGMFILLFGFDLKKLALLTLIMSISTALLQYPAGLLIDYIGKKKGLIIAEIIAIPWIIGVFLASLYPEYSLFFLTIAYLFLGIHTTFWLVSKTLVFIDIDSSLPATYYGLFSFFQNLGWIPAAFIGGIIFSLLGISTLLIITLLGILGVIILFSRYIHHDPSIHSETIFAETNYLL